MRSALQPFLLRSTMPSVRVKRGHNNYAALDDDTQGRQASHPRRRRSHTLSSLFTPDPPAQRADSTSSAPGSTPPTNPYGTIPRRGSRVADHVMRGSVRSSQAPTLRERNSSQPLRASPTSHDDGSYERDSAGNYLIEGAQETVAVPQDPLHGRVGSALSLQSQQGDENGHHEDDIVDHLDVIGTLSVDALSVSSHAFSDPAIATVSNLANAANAIVMCAFPYAQISPALIFRIDHRCHSILVSPSSYSPRPTHGPWRTDPSRTTINLTGTLKMS